ncbi:hypothetical protein GQ457_16G016580 [Hibiscus cannabinus]
MDDKVPHIQAQTSQGVTLQQEISSLWTAINHFESCKELDKSSLVTDFAEPAVQVSTMEASTTVEFSDSLLAPPLVQGVCVVSTELAAMEHEQLLKDSNEVKVFVELLVITDVESDNFDYLISGLLEVIGPGETGMLDERLQRINASRESIHLVVDCPLDLEDMFSANHLQSLGDLTLIVPVLKTQYWPTLLKISYNQSAKILTLDEKFRSYYLGTHTSGRLTRQTNMGTVAKTTFGKGPKLELNVLTYQMCVLMFWNNVDRPSDIEIEQATEIFATYLEASNPWTPKELFVFEFFFKVGKCCALIVLGNLTTLMNDDRFDSGNNDIKYRFRTSYVQPNIGKKRIKFSFAAKFSQLEVADLVVVGKIRTQHFYSRDVDNETKQASQVWILEGNELFFQLHVVGATIFDANKLRWHLVLEDLDGETMSKKKFSCDVVLEIHFAYTILNAQQTPLLAHCHMIMNCEVYFNVRSGWQEYQAVIPWRLVSDIYHQVHISLLLFVGFAFNEAWLDHIIEAPEITKWFQEVVNVGNPKAVSLVSKIHKNMPIDSTSFNNLLLNPFNSSELFATAYLSSVDNCVKESTYCQPLINSLWSSLINTLLPDIVLQTKDAVSVSRPLRNHISGRKSSSSKEEINKNIQWFCEVFKGSILEVVVTNVPYSNRDMKEPSPLYTATILKKCHPLGVFDSIAT